MATENTAPAENTTATYTQLRCKCTQCGLHFIICTWYPEAHGASTIHCPECGNHGRRFLVWQVEIEGYIFQAVPGDATILDVS